MSLLPWALLGLVTLCLKYLAKTTRDDQEQKALIEKHGCLSTPRTPESKTFRNRPPGADLPSEHRVAAHAALPVPFPPDRIHSQAGLPWDSRVRHGDSAVLAVTLWIREDLTDSFNLSCDQLFEKREAIAEDVVLFISTLWELAYLNHCEPDTRLATYAAVLLKAVGGFRSWEILGMQYRDVELGVMRDLVHRDLVRLLATITVRRCRMKTKVVKKGKANVLTFTVAPAPCQTIDLVSVLAAIGVCYDALDLSFESIDKLLYRPHLEYTDYLPLRWDDEVLDKPIIDMSYFYYWTLWNRVIHVFLLRTALWPYSLQVGTGARHYLHCK